MTRTILLIILLLALLVLGLTYSPVIAENSGYVLITVAGWKLEMTLVSAFILFALSVFVVWLGFRVTATFAAMGRFSWRWFSDFGSHRQRLHYEQGLISLLAMDIDDAEKHLRKVKPGYEGGIVALLLSHCAAQRSDAEQQKSALLQAQAFSKTKDAAELLLARYFQQHEEPQQALELLENSETKMALELKLSAMAKGGRWQQLLEFLESNKKKLGKAKVQQWKQQANIGLFSEKASKEGAEALLAHWNGLPGKDRRDVACQFALISQLLQQNYHQKAEEFLVEFQSRSAVPELLPLFRQLKLQQPLASKRKLESWLKQNENDAELLSTLGELSYNSGDLPLAEKVLLKAIKLRNNINDVQLLAGVKEANNDRDQALQLYKQVTESQAQKT